MHPPVSMSHEHLVQISDNRDTMETGPAPAAEGAGWAPGRGQGDTSRSSPGRCRPGLCCVGLVPDPSCCCAGPSTHAMGSPPKDGEPPRSQCPPEEGQLLSLASSPRPQAQASQPHPLELPTHSRGKRCLVHETHPLAFAHASPSFYLILEACLRNSAQGCPLPLTSPDETAHLCAPHHWALTFHTV